MNPQDAVSKVIIPALMIGVFLVNLIKGIQEARKNEATINKGLVAANELRITEIHAQYQGDIAFLREQLDNCLDASRPKRINS